MYATNHYEALILNVLRGQQAVAPSALYVALYLSNPGEAGTSGIEVSYAGYARQAIQFSTPAPLNEGVGVQNVNTITFPTTPSNVGTATHLGVLDSASGGNMLLYGEFAAPVQLEINEAPIIGPGNAQWWLSGSASSAFRTQALNLLRGQNIDGVSPHIAMYNGSPESGGAELSGSGYQRLPIAFSAPAEQSGGLMQMSNASQIESAEATSPWGVWNYTAIYSAQAGGTPLFLAPDTEKEMRIGTLVTFEAGAVVVSLN